MDCRHCHLPIVEVKRPGPGRSPMLWAHQATLKRAIAESLIHTGKATHDPEPQRES